MRRREHGSRRRHGMLPTQAGSDLRTIDNGGEQLLHRKHPAGTALSA
jgi:hypothetical protein